MHQFRSRRKIIVFFLVSILEIAQCVIVPLTIVMIFVGLLTGLTPIIDSGFLLAFSAIVIVIARWWIGSTTQCPLCKVPVLGNAGCSMHRRASQIAGNPRLPVAFSCLMKRRFTCPYCHERTELRVKS